MKKLLRSKSVVLASLSLFAACAHHRDVRPGADGTHRVVTRGSEREGAAREALRQANHFCKEQKKYAAIVAEETKYTGTMDEATHETVRRVSKVASILGGPVNTNSIDSPVSQAGDAGDVMTSDDYLTDMKFRCQ